nr:MAG: DNA packaging protein [Bacteriophage sp.]
MASANKQLDNLHRMLVEYLTDRLEDSRRKDDSGNIISPMAAAELSVLRQFLKDNGIVADSDHAEDLLGLQAQLAKEKSDAERKAILADAVNMIADDGTMH